MLRCCRAAVRRPMLGLPLNKFPSSASSTSQLTRFLATNKPDFNREIEQKYFDFPKLEKSIYSWWESEGYFKPIEDDALGEKEIANKNKAVTSVKKKKKKPFVLPMPPPNVTGYLHMGHAIFVALQDIMARFHRMRGEPTLWLPGTDHAGIATQLLVEKQLLAQGTSRAALGRERFLERVWQWKVEKGGYITQQMRRLGASADWSREKFTLDDDMNIAVTEAFVRLYEKGLIYRGNYMVNWSPSLQTAVSDLEVDHVEEEGRLYFFKYELVDVKGENGDSVFIPVATTRPETILGDTAVCVHPEDERYRHLVGKRVRVPMTDRSIPVIADEYVDREFGTGALKITPAHDPNDYKLGEKHSLPLINVMNRDATMNSEGGSRYAGLDRFVCREQLWKDMESAGLTIRVEKHMQRVPRSQRGGEVVEPLVSAQWFVRMEDMAQRACQVVRDKELQIVPERFEKVWFHWLENIHDWCVSRQLWWGHRIPVYYVRQRGSESVRSDAAAQFVVARSMEDAQRLARERFGEEVELVQDEDVLDTWFSSGLWPFATLGWPHHENTPNTDLSRYFPGSVLETGYDILFFWVARMVTLSLTLTDKTPFETIYLHGLVRDAQGEKMSKTKGNVIDPLETVQSFGADALRFSLVTGSTPGQDVPLSLEKVEANRNFVNKLWNVGKYVHHAVHSSSLTAAQRESLAVTRVLSKDEILSLPLPERFIVSQAHALVRDVSADLEKLRFGESGRRVYEFLYDDLADWFVEASKTHLKTESDSNIVDGNIESDSVLLQRESERKKREDALRVLVYVWDVCLRVLHPYMPFVTETLWQTLPHCGDTLMHAPWPTELLCESDVCVSQDDAAWSLYVDECAVREFSQFKSLVRGVRNARAEHDVDVGKRIPAIVQSSSASFLTLLQEESKALALLARVNEKELDCVPWTEGEGQKIDVKSRFASRGPFVHLVVEDGIEVFLPQSGLLDKEKERARLAKQQERLVKDVESVRARLANKKFAEKAPPAVVEEATQRLRDLEQQLSVVRETLASLS